MKYLAWIGGIIVTLFILLYIVVFTPFGNGLLQPIIEKKIQEQSALDSKLTKFVLSMSSLDILLELDSENKIALNGNYSLFLQNLDLSYQVALEELKNLQTLANAPIQGKFHTNGSIKGDKKFLEINGLSDVASSSATYHIELTEFNPTSIIAKVKEAKLDELLYLGAQKPYANALIDLDMNFKSIKLHELDGNILLSTKDGKVDTKLMQSDFNITLPKTDFSMSLDATLEKDDVNYSYALLSNLAKLTSSGIMTPEPLATDIKYNLDIKELALLQPITNAPLRGVFSTNGVVKGTKKSMLIDGKSNLAQSKTSYRVDLQKFKPLSVIASIKGAKLQKLLYMLGQPSFASSILDVDVKLSSLDPKNLAGKIDMSLSKGILNSKVMKKVYKVNLPHTTFSSKTHADFKGKSIDYITSFSSNLANLSSSGNIIPDTMSMDLLYKLDIKELAALKPITGADLRGSFDLKGNVKGNKEHLNVDGKSNFAASDTSFHAVLKNFSPASLKAKMHNLQLAKTLYLVKQPHYADGIISLDIDILDARSGKLNGKVTSSIKKGTLNSAYMTKAYKFNTKMPRSTFKLETTTKLHGELADTKIDFDSSLATFDISRARMNLKDGSLVSDYVAKIPSLDKLYFATDRHMRGGLNVNGELKKAKNLDLTIYSKLAGGKVDAKLHNDDFHADLKSLQTLDVLHILIYPEMFKSTINGKLDYNLLHSKGSFNGELVDGKFTKNQMLTLVKQYGKVDLYAEKFKGNVSAKINKEHILASMDLKSRVSSITTKDTKLNSKTKQIDSTIKISANNNPITVTLKGDTASPKVGVDVQDLVKKEATKAVKKELGKLLKKFF